MNLFYSSKLIFTFTSEKLFIKKQLKTIEGIKQFYIKIFEDCLNDKIISKTSSKTS
jgi:hypothetical protein